MNRLIAESGALISKSEPVRDIGLSLLPDRSGRGFVARVARHRLMSRHHRSRIEHAQEMRPNQQDDGKKRSREADRTTDYEITPCKHDDPLTLDQPSDDLEREQSAALPPARFPPSPHAQLRAGLPIFLPREWLTRSHQTETEWQE